MGEEGNEMAFQLRVQMWQYWLCNENVSGVAQLVSMNTVLHTGLKYVRKKKGSVKHGNVSCSSWISSSSLSSYKRIRSFHVFFIL